MSFVVCLKSLIYLSSSADRCVRQLQLQNGSLQRRREYDLTYHLTKKISDDQELIQPGPIIDFMIYNYCIISVPFGIFSGAEVFAVPSA